ncbi:hypothetical protein HDV04_005723 [Boothiomyces sp. JEL0838]|nr:hypothetical protein HDV04_005723 [Boothiomyces sp. JEL0838]
MFSAIPVELEIVSCHLTLYDYHQLRFAFQNGLPTYPNLTFNAYKESTQWYAGLLPHKSDGEDPDEEYEIRNDLDVSEYISLTPESLNDSVFYFICIHSHVKQFSKIKLHRIDQSTIKEMLLLKPHIQILSKLIQNINFSKLTLQELCQIWLHAAECGSLESIKLILKDQRVGADHQDNYAFRCCLKKGYYDLAKYLLNEVQINPTFSENYPIRIASQNGHLNIVKLLLQDTRVDPSALHNQALQIAAKNGYAEIVALLLKHPSVNPSQFQNQLIVASCARQNAKVVQTLILDPRVDPTASSNQAIRNSAYWGHAEVVKCLMKDKRVDPSARDNFALFWASKNGHLEVVKLLLRDQRVHSGIFMALHEARTNGHIEVAQVLESAERVYSRRMGVFENLKIALYQLFK